MAQIQITEQDINNMVMDAVKKVLNEDKQHRNRNKENAKRRELYHSGNKVTANTIIQWLQDPTTDCAAIAAKLWPNKSEDSRRSYFYKCRDHKTYTAKGKSRRYDFTRQQYLKLYQIMTEKH